MMISKKVVVIGAGAAGLMAGATAALYGASVTIIEKNKRVGRKIMITGKGRCNLANNCDVQTFINNVPVNGRFLYSAINAFTPEDTIEFFESKGLKTKTERGNRVFPASDKSVDVVDTMHDYAVESGCKIVCDTANALILEDGAVIGVKCEENTYYADSVIICCGGKSYPLTGSTGDGYTLAKQAGHTIVPLKPSLVPFTSGDKRSRCAASATLYCSRCPTRSRPCRPSAAQGLASGAARWPCAAAAARPSPRRCSTRPWRR